MNALQPYKPSPERPWNRESAAHLLRRAGFAPSEHEVRQALEAGPAATVDRLVDARTDGPRHDELDALGPGLAARGDIDRLREWWLLRMCHTNRPLHARMTLFWHDHFATSNAKVDNPAMMLAQLRTLERHTLGRFEDLLLAVSRDPAMIVWLDGELNVKGRPNENYAREFFELFSLGIGNYSETDIREAARAFTGWHQRNGVFRLVRRAHDTDTKTVLGTTGPLDGSDVVHIALRHSACAPFLATKLLREFICPHPPAALIEALAVHLRQNGFDVADTMRALLASEAMFDPQWYRARIKSPVEYAVGLVRSLETSPPARVLADAVSRMGQRLFEPPSVKGWEAHRAWINATTMLVRLNAAVAVTRKTGAARLDAAHLRHRHDLDTHEQVLGFCETLTLDGHVPSSLHDRLAASSERGDAFLRRALRFLVASPEYQMA